ncbi:224_t:CDS:2, partial [Gigaspora margarita]
MSMDMYGQGIGMEKFFPKKHAFEYPILLVGIDLELLEKNSRGGFILGYNNRMAIFNINDNDYLGCVNEHDIIEDTAKKNRTIKEKLFLHIKKHNMETENLRRVELVTMPRFFGYAFNPVSIYYCYDITDALKIIVLEVNNTFGEKHLYIMDRDSEADKSTRLG